MDYIKFNILNDFDVFRKSR